MRYRCSTEPDRVYFCHCSNCRKVSGTAFHTGVMVRRGAFEPPFPR
ncbi:MAG: GFA family protein [Alphaproteobacteria bacterium]|nr:GFA family protein [Alphaproteobacteria bacterium]